MIWEEYLHHLNISHEDVREGCEPRIYLHRKPVKNSIILIHGLTDSPHFMSAIGRYFFHQLGFNVFIPLLTGHGSKSPTGMEKVTLEDWLDDIEFAIFTAKESSVRSSLSMGGLSLGGTLSVHQALSTDKITGALFLFSTTLGLTSDTGRRLGRVKELILKNKRIAVPIARRSMSTTLIGENPYRYCRMDLFGAIQLARLLEKIDQKIDEIKISLPVFVAHSEYDSTACIMAIENFIKKCPKYEFFRVGKEFHLPHASMVLKELIKSSNGSPLEPANPYFDEMLVALHNFSKKYLTTG